MFNISNRLRVQLPTAYSRCTQRNLITTPACTFASKRRGSKRRGRGSMADDFLNNVYTQDTIRSRHSRLREEGYPGYRLGLDLEDLAMFDVFTGHMGLDRNGNIQGDKKSRLRNEIHKRVKQNSKRGNGSENAKYYEDLEKEYVYKAMHDFDGPQTGRRGGKANRNDQTKFYEGMAADPFMDEILMNGAWSGHTNGRKFDEDLHSERAYADGTDPYSNNEYEYTDPYTHEVHSDYDAAETYDEVNQDKFVTRTAEGVEVFQGEVKIEKSRVPKGHTIYTEDNDISDQEMYAEFMDAFGGDPSMSYARGHPDDSDADFDIWSQDFENAHMNLDEHSKREYIREQVRKDRAREFSKRKKQQHAERMYYGDHGSEDSAFEDMTPEEAAYVRQNIAELFGDHYDGQFNRDMNDAYGMYVLDESDSDMDAFYDPRPPKRGNKKSNKYRNNGPVSGVFGGRSHGKKNFASNRRYFSTSSRGSSLHTVMEEPGTVVNTQEQEQPPVYMKKKKKVRHVRQHRDDVAPLKLDKKKYFPGMVESLHHKTPGNFKNMYRTGADEDEDIPVPVVSSSMKRKSKAVESDLEHTGVSDLEKELEKLVIEGEEEEAEEEYGARVDRRGLSGNGIKYEEGQMFSSIDTDKSSSGPSIVFENSMFEDEEDEQHDGSGRMRASVSSTRDPTRAAVSDIKRLSIAFEDDEDADANTNALANDSDYDPMEDVPTDDDYYSDMDHHFGEDAMSASESSSEYEEHEGKTSYMHKKRGRDVQKLRRRSTQPAGTANQDEIDAEWQRDLEGLISDGEDPYFARDEDKDWISDREQSLVGKIVGGEPLFSFAFKESEIEERFIRGSGPGGQATNKTRNCVLLQHIPTGTIVKCHQTRSLFENRMIARKIMKRKLEMLQLGQKSYLGRKQERIRRRKDRQRRRYNKKLKETGNGEHEAMKE